MAYFRCKFDNKEPELTMYAEFSGDGYITLPFSLNENYKITVDFEVSSYNNNRSVIGNSSGANYIHLTPFNSKWYTSNGTSEINFSNTLTGRHKFIFNDNGTVKFDNTIVESSINAYTANYKYRIGGRAGASSFIGKIYNFKIEDIVNNISICDIKVTKIDGEYRFVDVINNVKYSCGGMLIKNYPHIKPNDYPFKEEYTIYGSGEKIGHIGDRTATKIYNSGIATCVGAFRFRFSSQGWGHPMVLISDDPKEIGYNMTSVGDVTGYEGTLTINGKTYYYSHGSGLYPNSPTSTPSGSIPYLNSEIYATYQDGIMALVQAALIEPAEVIIN